MAYRGPSSSRLCPDQIEWELGTRVIGRRVAVWNRVTSTNDLASRASASLANEGLVILAEEQSGGRGSRGRTWSSPPGSSILMSVLLFPAPPMDEPGWLTALGAVAVAEVVAGLGVPGARIKWPNDVRVGGRKLAGVLVERGRGTVLGIGLNVNVEDFPEEIRDSATSLRRLLGRPLDRSEIARSLIRRLDFHQARAIADGPGALNEPYRGFSEHLGRVVRVTTTSGTLDGRLAGLDLRSGLVLEGAGGTARRIEGPDVVAILNLGPDPALRGVDTGRPLPDDLGGLDDARRLRGRIIDQIDPHPLWVGHAGDGGDLRKLHELGIEAVVQLAAEEPSPTTPPPRGLIHLRFPLVDGSGNLPEHLMLAVGAVEGLIRLRVPTLVCCGMGLSRSPAVASVALARVLRELPDEVLRRLADRHPVDVSPGFWREVRAIRPWPVGFEASASPRA